MILFHQKQRIRKIYTYNFILFIFDANIIFRILDIIRYYYVYFNVSYVNIILNKYYTHIIYKLFQFFIIHFTDRLSVLAIDILASLFSINLSNFLMYVPTVTPSSSSNMYSMSVNTLSSQNFFILPSTIKSRVRGFPLLSAGTPEMMFSLSIDMISCGISDLVMYLGFIPRKLVARFDAPSTRIYL